MSNDCRNMQYIGLTRLLLQSSSIHGCRPSVPSALLGWILWSFLQTVYSVNGMSTIHSFVLLYKHGLVDVSSSTKTELKQSPRTSAASWSFSVKTPSWFLSWSAVTFNLLLGSQISRTLLWFFLEIVE